MTFSYNNRGDAYSGKGQYDRAIADSGQGIRLDPVDPLAHTARGLAYEKKGDTARAKADLYAAIAVPPNSMNGAWTHATAAD